MLLKRNLTFLAIRPNRGEATSLSTQLRPALAAGKERSRRYLRKVSFLELTLEEED